MTLRRPLIRAAALLSLLSVATLAVADNVVLSGSSIIATFRQENVPVDAPFKKFTGSILYDPAHPTAASASLSVDTGSLDIGDAQYNAEVLKPAWFDTAHYPQALFKSTSVTSQSADHFTAVGTLSIKGHAQTISVPISVRKSGSTTFFEGSFDLSRKAYAIGDPIWEDVLDDKVHVHFSLSSTGR